MYACDEATHPLLCISCCCRHDNDKTVSWSCSTPSVSLHLLMCFSRNKSEFSWQVCMMPNCTCLHSSNRLSAPLTIPLLGQTSSSSLPPLACLLQTCITAHSHRNTIFCAVFWRPPSKILLGIIQNTATHKNKLVYFGVKLRLHAKLVKFRFFFSCGYNNYTTNPDPD